MLIYLFLALPQLSLLWKPQVWELSRSRGAMGLKTGLTARNAWPEGRYWQIILLFPVSLACEVALKALGSEHTQSIQRILLSFVLDDKVSL